MCNIYASISTHFYSRTLKSTLVLCSILLDKTLSNLTFGVPLATSRPAPSDSFLVLQNPNPSKSWLSIVDFLPKLPPRGINTFFPLTIGAVCGKYQ